MLRKYITNQNFKGALWMLIASFMFALSSFYSGFRLNTVDPKILFFLSNLFALFFYFLLNIFSLKSEKDLYKITLKDFLIFVARGFFLTMGSISWFYSITSMNINNATAISYFTPVLNLLGAVIILNEKLTAKSLFMFLLAFLGMCFVIQPNINLIGTSECYALFSAFLWSVNDIISKKFISNFRPKIHSFYMLLVTSVFGAIFIDYQNFVIEYEDIISILILSFLVLGNILCVYRAYALSTFNIIMPIDFTRVIFTAILSYVILNDVLEIKSIIGIVLIYFSVAYICKNQFQRLYG